MYYRTNFNLPLHKESLASFNSLNNEQINSFRRSITPELAEKILSIAKAYPTLDKRLAVYTGLYGLEADDDLILRLAQKQQNALEKQQRSVRQSQVGWGKRATQLGFLALDAPFQNISQNFKSTVVAAQETGMPVGKAVAKNLLTAFSPSVESSDAARESLLGEEFAKTYRATKEAYGPTEWRRAREQQKAGNPLNLGTGILPNSMDLQDTEVYRKEIKLGKTPLEAYTIAEQTYGKPITDEFEKDEYRYKYTTPQGERVPISPGRVVAGQFSKEGDISYALTSTIIDGAFRLGADPINILLGYGSGIKTAARSVVTQAAVDDFVRNTPTIARALKTLKPTKGGREARALTFGKTANQILDTKWGDEFVDAMTQNTSVARLRMIPGFKKLDPRVLDYLAKVGDKNIMRESLRSLMRQGDFSELMIAPYSGAFVGDEIRLAAQNAPLTKLPMRKSLVGEASDALAKRLGGSTDVAPLRRTVGAFMGKMKNDPFAGLVGMGSQLMYSLPLKTRRLFDLAPDKYAAVTQIAETVNNIEGSLIAMGEKETLRDLYIKEILESKNQQDVVNVVEKLNERIAKFVVKNNPDLAEDPDALEEMIRVSKVVSNTLETKKYFYDADGVALSFPGTKIEYLADAVQKADGTFQSKTVAAPTALTMSQFAEHFVPLIDYQQLAKAGKRFNRLVGPSGSRLKSVMWHDPKASAFSKINQQFFKVPRKAFVPDPSRGGRVSLSPKGNIDYVYNDIVMQRVLKPSWMLRLALALRVPPEESVRLAYYGGPNVFSHPVLLTSLKSDIGRKGKTVVQMQGSLGEQFMATRLYNEEAEMLAEMIGNKDLVNSITNLKYEQIEKSIKHLRLNVNAAGEVGDSYLASFLRGDNMTDYAFDEIIGELPKLKKQKVTDRNVRLMAEDIMKWDLEDIENAVLKIDGTTLEGAAVSVAPYKSLKTTIDKAEEGFQQTIEQYLSQPNVMKALQKENHVLQVTRNFAGDVTQGEALVPPTLIDLNVGIVNKTVNNMTFQQAKDTLINSLSIAIKSHERYVYPTKAMVEALSKQEKLYKLIDLRGQIPRIRIYDGIDNINIDSVVKKEILEAMFESNFNTAKLIMKKKGGYAQAAPSGTIFNGDPMYIQAQSNQTLLQRFLPGKNRKSKDEMYLMAKKHKNTGSDVIQEEWWYGFIEDLFSVTKDPAYVIVARDGVENAVEYFTKDINGKQYIQDLIKQSDEPEIRRILEKESELKKWLQAINYDIARLQGNPSRKIRRGNRGISQRQAREIIHNAEGEMILPDYEADLSLGSQQVKEFIANSGFLNGEDWLELAQKHAVLNNRTRSYYGKFYKKVKKAFNEDIVVNGLGPREQAYLKSGYDFNRGATYESTMEKWDKVLEAGYRNLLAKPSDWLNRDPMFRWSFYTEAPNFIPTFDEKTTKEFLVGAKPWIEGSQMWDDIVRASKIPKIKEEVSVTSLEQAEQLLKYKALENVKDLLYASSDRHVLSDVMATYVPFPEIWQEVAKTWGKLTIDNPQKFNRTRITIDAGKESKPWDTHNAFFETDPVTGELMFNWVDVANVMTFGVASIPGQMGFAPVQSALLGEDLRDEGVKVRPYGFLEGLNLVAANGFSPGFGPNVQMAYKLFTKYFPTPKFLDNFILGNFNAPGGGFNIADELPGWAKDIILKQPFMGDGAASEEMEASVAATVMDIYTMYYYAGKWTPDDTESQKAALIEAMDAASKHWIIRGMAKGAFPTAIQPRYELKDKNGTWWGIQVLAQKYQQMLENNDFDYFVTSQQFITRFGINPIPLRQATTEKKGRFPARKESFKFWQQTENKQLIEEYPQTAIYIKMDSWDDEFSYPAFLEGSETLDPQDYRRALQQTLLQFELEEYRQDLVNDPSQTDSSRREAYTSKKNKLVDEYKMIPYGNIGNAIIRAEQDYVMQEFRMWEDNEILKNSAEYKPLKLFLDKYDEAINVVLNGGTFTVGDESYTVYGSGVKNKTAANLKGSNENTAAIRILLDKYARQLANEYKDTNFIDMYLGNFWKELDNRRYEKDF